MKKSISSETFLAPPKGNVILTVSGGGRIKEGRWEAFPILEDDIIRSGSPRIERDWPDK
ncbi:MAG: hypothetical protein IJK73_05025 [Bacteroidales bacterium]|nr:hypothetical protein [Bacteroidales bacterium]